MSLPASSANWRTALGLWLVLWTIWVAVNSSLEPSVLVLGLLLTGTVATAVARMSRIWDGLRFTPRTVCDFARYTVIFLLEIVKSNLQMLRYVYAPRITIQPAIIPTRTRLTSPMGRFVLGNTVSLTPGTLVMGLEGDTLFVHCLDLHTTDIDVNSAAVSGAFEPTLARTFG